MIGFGDAPNIIKIALAITLLIVPSICGANGEPSADAVNSGILIPINDTYTHVLDQRIDVTLPKPPRRGEEIPAADIKVRYELENVDSSAATISVAWPSGGISGSVYEQDRPEYPVHISLDGKSLPFKFLRKDALSEPYIAGWLKQIDKLLQSKPKLRAKVLAVRKMVPKPSKKIFDDAYISKCVQLANQFEKWLVENGYKKGYPQYRKGIPHYHDSVIAAGLLGIPIEGALAESCVQSALQWLNPKYKRLDLDDELAARWGYDTLLLDPKTHWLTNIEGPMLYGADFAVIRFDIKLKPKTKHILNVNYKQRLGWVGRPQFLYGLTYFMEPARRWGRWDKTTIKITAPSGWDKVVVRPTPSSATKTDQSRTLTIAMKGRPYEDLYISLVPQ